MNYFVVLIAVVLLACSKEKTNPEPNLSEDTKAERAATIDSFVNEWIYSTNNEPYKKIVIEKTGSAYTFKHYVKLTSTFKLDTTEYYAQELSLSNYVAWDKSSTYHPYTIISSRYSSGYSWMTYRMISGQQYLELGSGNYK